MCESRGPSLPPWLKLSLRIVLAGYWVAMGLGTHLPNPPDVVPSNVSDTWLHLGAYLGLGVLLVLARLCRTRWQAFGLACAYGAMDELTQMIPVLHRSAEWKDLAADVVGAGLGVVIGGLCAAWADSWFGCRAGSDREPTAADDREHTDS